MAFLHLSYLQDNASYHTKSDAPKSGDTIKAHIEWMDKKNISFPDEWRQRGYGKQIKEFVKKYKDEHPDFNAEAMAKKYGHFILRLPPYHCEL